MDAKKIILAAIVVINGIILVSLVPNKEAINEIPVVIRNEIKPEVIAPDKYEITEYPEKYLGYSEVISWLQKWNKEAPEITEFGNYGEKTPEGNTCHYLRTGTVGKPKILIHSMIHGNERLAGAATMKMLERFLHDYGRNEEATWLLKNRDVYWIPVISPDTYLRSRYVEKVDPNRDYPYPGRRPHTPSTPIRNIMKFCTDHQFAGVISGHTTGEDYFWPSLGPKEDQDAHRELARKMATISRYSPSKIANGPQGYEIDWYYWNGSVAILTEFGQGSHEQPTRTIMPTAERCYGAYLLFIREAPEIKINPPSQ